MAGNNIERLSEVVSSKLGVRLLVDTTRPLEKASFKNRVADATSAYFIDGFRRQDDCVLIMSPEGFPDQVRHAVTKAATAQSLVGNGLSTRICTPLLSGVWDGRSFAVYPRLDAFSANRWLRRAQTLRAAPGIIAWLAQTFDATVRDRSVALDLEFYALRPLKVLFEDNELSNEVRTTARVVSEAVEERAVRIVTCLEHGDFWTGNILFERSRINGLAPFLDGFKVIDWAGSNSEGYPGSDALRFVTSAFGMGGQSALLLRAYGRRTGLSDTDLSLGCLCALGHLGCHLNRFPKDRYTELVERIYKFLERNSFFQGFILEERPWIPVEGTAFASNNIKLQ